MINRTTIRRAGATLRHALCVTLATATLTGTLAYPAFADNDHDRSNRRWHESRRDEHRYYYSGYDRYYSGYDRQPVYYGAPPVVYAPPGASLNLNFPLYR